jgi:hypothetical protein
MKKSAWILKCLLGITLAFFLFAGITFLLWNWLVPSLFSGPPITFWQSLGLLVLTKILFFGLGSRKQCYSQEGYQSHWKSRFGEKMAALSPEEREAFKQKMKEKWCSPVKKQEG